MASVPQLDHGPQQVTLITVVENEVVMKADPVTHLGSWNL